MNPTNHDNKSFLSSQKSNKSALNLTLRYLSYRSRTLFEVRRYLQKKNFDEETIASVLDYLVKQNYLNDEQYCKLFLEYRYRNKPKSVFALSYELKAKGIKLSLIESMLLCYNDDELALKAVKTKILHWHNFDNDKFKKKIMNYLKNRGFSYSVCVSTLNKIRNFTKDEYEN